MAVGRMRVPEEDVGSAVSQPSARELPGTPVLLANNRIVEGEPSRDVVLNVCSTRRANAPTA